MFPLGLQTQGTQGDVGWSRFECPVQLKEGSGKMNKKVARGGRERSFGKLTGVRWFPLVLGVVLYGCATAPPAYEAAPGMETPSSAMTLGPGDVIEVKYRFWPELDDQQTVRPDGKISLQLIDEVEVKGLTPEELDTRLTELYASKLKNPDITVIVRSLANQNIYVGGEVVNPGLIPLQGNLTALQAVINAGGFTEGAKPEEAIVIRKGPENRPVPIRVDLDEAIYGNNGGGNLMLQASDVVYVPKTAIAKANKFVNQYIERLLLIRGASLGFGYELHSESSD